MDSLIGEVFDDMSFDDFEEENMVSSSSPLCTMCLSTTHGLCTYSHLDSSQVVSVGISLQGHCSALPLQTPVHQLT